MFKANIQKEDLRSESREGGRGRERDEVLGRVRSPEAGGQSNSRSENGHRNIVRKKQKISCVFKKFLFLFFLIVTFSSHSSDGHE